MSRTSFVSNLYVVYSKGSGTIFETVFGQPHVRTEPYGNGFFLVVESVIDKMWFQELVPHLKCLKYNRPNENAPYWE
mgnify:FL=1